MNIRSILKFEQMYIYFYVLYFIIKLYFISACKYIYWFEENEDSEIIFYYEIQENKIDIKIRDDCMYWKIIYDINSSLKNRLNYVCTYDNKNFITFEVLNVFLDSNKSKNRKGMIECNFELSYALKITKNIFELPDKISFSQLKCLLFTLKHLRANANKNMFKLLQRIIFKLYSETKDGKLKKLDLYFKEIFRYIVSAESNLDIKKGIISAFFNNLIIGHIFYEDNLILTTNTTKSFKTDLLNENIPYKNLLIYDFKVFCILENIFKNYDISNTFQILLNEINVKSLIINNYQGTEFIDIDFVFFKPLAHNFKSIIISNLHGYSENILNELYDAVTSNLEYFGLKNLMVNCNHLVRFLSKQKLKGLILDRVYFYTDIHYFDSYMNSNKSLEYIELKNIETEFNWLNRFTRTSNIKKFILCFDSGLIEKYFIKECDLLLHFINILYLEIWFHKYIISKELCNFLKRLIYLKTLRLFNYKPNISMEGDLYKAFENMKCLENLVFKNTYLSEGFYNILFQRKNIKSLELIDSRDPKSVLIIGPFSNGCSITHLILRGIKISRYGLIEIFKLQNLKVLFLKFCEVKSVENSPPFNFASRNIKKLCLKTSNLYENEIICILSRLKDLENLKLTDFLLHSCCLARLNTECNRRLKKLSYERGGLCINDLIRIKQLEVLEKLKFYKCKFIGTCFVELGEDCKFFDSLRHLSLWGIDTDLITIQYLLNFKNLQDLEIPFLPFTIWQVKISLVYSPQSSFITKELYKKVHSKIFYGEIYSNKLTEYFKELGIEAAFKCLI